MSIAALDTDTIKARPGSRISDKQAREIAPELFALERRDGLATPEAVITAAREPTSALHGLFDWDDASAAHKQRLQMARQVIRSVVYRVQSIGKNIDAFTPAFVHVREEAVGDEHEEPANDRGGGYANITRVLGEEKLRARMLEAARRDLQAWIQRYETLAALEKGITKARELLEEIKAA
jgi:hypothetical protein